MAGNRRYHEPMSYSFSELVDIAAFSHLLESFYKATGIPNGLVAPTGELISQAGWTIACAHFHRVHPETQKRCQESNIELMSRLQNGEVAGCLCGNGLLDYATPVVVEGKQLATLFLGQVLNEPPKLDFFRQQAAQFGFDEGEYLDAIRDVPILSRDKLEAHMDHMVEVAQVLAMAGLARLRERRLRQDLERSTERRIELEDILTLAPLGIGWADSHGRIEYLNHQFSELFGYANKEVPDLQTWFKLAFPDPAYRAQVIDPWRAAVAKARAEGTVPPELEANVTCKDGSERRIFVRVSWVGEKVLVNYTDITGHWKSELRNRTHGAMLEMVARGELLSDILHAISLAVEAEEPTAKCSILLLDREGKRLHNGAAPSLPSFYNEAIDGIEIGMGAGSCGTAAYSGKRVIVEDVSTHEYWRPYAELAKQAGLGSCWSEPIFSSTGQVLGTFAVYHADRSTPGEEDIERITFAANLSAVAIESQHQREELIERERKFRSLAENSPDNIARYDTEGRCIYVNPCLHHTLGMSDEQILHKHPRDYHPDGRFDHYDAMIQQVLGSGNKVQFELTAPTPRGIEQHHIHMVPEYDAAGIMIGVLAIGRDITERKHLEQELERQAHLDFLTGLANRRHFLEQAETELSRIKRYGGELSLIMFDIDHFKQFNDTYGHSVGDLVLQKIADISKQSLREIDIIGRLGGEEFIALLPQTRRQHAIDAAERLRLAVANGEVRLENGTPVDFTASFGVVTVDTTPGQQTEEISIDSLLIEVDSAMYQAKQQGRNRVCLSQGDHRPRRIAKS